jgi:hypothetical protein
MPAAYALTQDEMWKPPAWQNVCWRRTLAIGNHPGGTGRGRQVRGHAVTDPLALSPAPTPVFECDFLEGERREGAQRPPAR